MKNEINNIKLQFACSQNWDGMKACESGKFCMACQNTVFDFTDKNQSDFDAIYQQNEGKVCGRFKLSQLASIQSLQKVAVLSASLMSFSACFKEELPNILPIQSFQEKPIKSDDSIIFGMIAEQLPDFEGGQKAMFKFLSDNVKWPVSHLDCCIEGTIYIGFIVTKEGRIEEVKVKRGLGVAFNEEALRLVKLMDGKWTAGKQNGKPVAVTYTIPIKFKLE
jgi:TonB family protein